jgi:hypothetical protein
MVLAWNLLNFLSVASRVFTKTVGHSREINCDVTFRRKKLFFFLHTYILCFNGGTHKKGQLSLSRGDSRAHRLTSKKVFTWRKRKNTQTYRSIYIYSNYMHADILISFARQLSSLAYQRPDWKRVKHCFLHAQVNKTYSKSHTVKS